MPPFSKFSSLKYGDSLLVLLASLLTASLCELLSWLLIYRTATYQSLRSSIHRASRKLDSMKSSSSSSSSSSTSLSSTSSSSLSSNSSKSKKIDRVETALRDSSRDLSLCKLKSGAVVALVLFAAFGVLSSLFEGRPVAKLPFSASGPVRKMSHRGLPGEDWTDCSMAFLYLLCSVSVRTNLQKLLGFAPPRGAPAGGGFFPMPDTKSS